MAFFTNIKNKAKDFKEKALLTLEMAKVIAQDKIGDARYYFNKKYYGDTVDNEANHQINELYVEVKKAQLAMKKEALQTPDQVDKEFLLSIADADLYGAANTLVRAIYDEEEL